MKAPLQKVAPGEPVKPINAAGWNALVDAAQAARTGRGKGEPNAPDNPATPGTVLIACQTAVPVPWFGIVTVPAIATMPIPPASNEFLQRVVIAGAAPSDFGQPFAVVLDAAQAQSGTMTAIVRGVVRGAVQCKVDVTDPGHANAETQGGNVSYLVSCPAGTAGSVPILQRQSGTGVQWCVILLPTTSEAAFSGLPGVEIFTYSAAGTFVDYGVAPLGSTFLTPTPIYDPGGFWSSGSQVIAVTDAYKGTYLVFGSIAFPDLTVSTYGSAGLAIYCQGAGGFVQYVPLKAGNSGAPAISLLSPPVYLDGTEVGLGSIFGGSGSDPGGSVTGSLTLVRLGP
jgi:hypothetical protein